MQKGTSIQTDDASQTEVYDKIMDHSLFWLQLLQMRTAGIGNQAKKSLSLSQKNSSLATKKRANRNMQITSQ